MCIRTCAIVMPGSEQVFDAYLFVSIFITTLDKTDKCLFSPATKWKITRDDYSAKTRQTTNYRKKMCQHNLNQKKNCFLGFRIYIYLLQNVIASKLLYKYTRFSFECINALLTLPISDNSEVYIGIHKLMGKII